MAVNPYANKVVFGNQTIIDLTSDTADADKVLQGYTFHDKSGQMRTGSFISPPNPDESGLIIVSYSDEFRGQTITCSNGQTTYSKTASILGNEVRFYPDSVGTWTISSTYSGQTFSKDVIISDLAESEETSLVAIPDGKTVLPVNDIQTWLHCAGIYDKLYTTLEEVLADNTTLLALISDSNAVDYMVRSTDWASSSSIGLVPAMTSNTTPSGVASGNSIEGTYYAYLAFDGDNTTYTGSVIGTGSGAIGSYIRYEFPSAKSISSIYVRLKNGQATSGTFKIQGSNDGSTFVDVSAEFTIATASDTFKEVTVSSTSSTPYKYFQLICTAYTVGRWWLSNLQLYGAGGIPENSNAMTYIGANNYCANTLLNDETWCAAICNSNYFEKVLNVKVPTMTSNTTPSGECFACASDPNGRGDVAYKAFDSDPTSSYWLSNGSGYSYIGYMFTSACKVAKISLNKVYYFNTGTKLQGSNDGSTWTDIATITSSITSSPYTGDIVVTNNSSYRYYRLYISQGVNTQASGIQFYGRRNV